MRELQDMAPVYQKMMGIAVEVEAFLEQARLGCEVYKLECHVHSILGILEFRPMDDSGEMQPLIGAAMLVFEHGNIRRGSILTPAHPFMPFRHVKHERNEIRIVEIAFPHAKPLAKQIADAMADAAHELHVARMAEAARQLRRAQHPVLFPR